MKYQPFLISEFVTGLDTDLQPWILPKDAFQSIVNGYIHHGVLSKRAGMQDFGFFVDASDPSTRVDLPIMGIKSFIDDDGVSQLLIFNTKRACIYNAGTGVFDPLDLADIFDGDNTSFVSSASYGKTELFGTSTFFFTNFNGDTGVSINPIRTYTSGASTSSFVPQSSLTNYIVAAQFIFAFQGRLLLLNTVEGNAAPVGSPPVGSGTNYAQRMRWSKARNPAASSQNWYDSVPGNGGFADAWTSEKIISAKALQDAIVVYFTNSIWSIEPASDPNRPFRWVKLNSFRACDAPYATIAHDRYSIAFGVRGIVACDRVEVQRIDHKIQDFMSNEVNLDRVQQMYSERNFNEQRSWTLYPSSTNNLDPSDEATTSNYALIRTDEEGAWSIYSVYTTDLDAAGTNLSCLGYGQAPTDLAFQDFTGDLDLSFEQFGSEVWSSYYTQANSEVFLGGDQTGRVLYLEKDGDDLGNDISFEVTSAGWNPFNQQGAQCQLGYIDFYVDADMATFFDVSFFSDDITDPYATQTLDCLPNLGFLADIQSVVLNNPVEVIAYSHGLEDGDAIFIYNLKGATNLLGGPYTVTVVDENTITIGIDGTTFDAYISGGMIVERAFANTKCWKRAYAGGKGYQHFVKITNTGTDNVLRFNAFMPWFRQAGERIIGG